MHGKQGLTESAMPGQVLISFALAFIVLLGFAALAVDATGAWMADQKQEEALTAVREAVMSHQNAIKYGEYISDREGSEPSTKTAFKICGDAIGDNLGRGADKQTDAKLSRIEIYVYELPESKTGPADRYIGVMVKAEAAWKPFFGGTVGLKNIPIKNEIAFVVHPYSQTQVFRGPVNAENGRYCDVDLSANPSYDFNGGGASISWSQLPQELRDTLDGACAQPSSVR